MSTTTPNFGWTIPSDTDLVTDGAAAMRELGDDIDTAFVDLKGGTTGQILSKASATDLDYTWITNDIGDITSVGVTSPITGGGTSGAVTIAIQDASTAQKGSVMLSDSTSTTSSILAATPTAVKAAYDLANGAIPKTLTTTTGDTIYASSANTPARLAVGATNQMLSVTAGVPAWKASTTSTLTTTGDTVYASAANTLARLTVGSTGQVLTVAGGVPTWATPSSSSGPTFLAYQSTGQTISASTDTKINFQTASWDTGSAWDNSTMRFTPLTAGYYQVNMTVLGFSSAGVMALQFFKNGSQSFIGTISGPNSGTAFRQTVTQLIYFNGSTDYISGYVNINGGSPSLGAGAGSTEISAVWIRT